MGITILISVVWTRKRVSRLARIFVIEMLHITKEFRGIKANDDIYPLQLRSR